MDAPPDPLGQAVDLLCGVGREGVVFVGVEFRFHLEPGEPPEARHGAETALPRRKCGCPRHGDGRRYEHQGCRCHRDGSLAGVQRIVDGQEGPGGIADEVDRPDRLLTPAFLLLTISGFFVLTTLAMIESLS